MMTALWAMVLAEPRCLIIVGLALDVIGAVLVAFTAWARVSAVLGFDTDKSTEMPKDVYRRRLMVIVGAGFLVVGFVLQGIAAWLQMGRGHPGYWTI